MAQAQGELIEQARALWDEVEEPFERAKRALARGDLEGARRINAALLPLTTSAHLLQERVFAAWGIENQDVIGEHRAVIRADTPEARAAFAAVFNRGLRELEWHLAQADADVKAEWRNAIRHYKHYAASAQMPTYAEYLADPRIMKMRRYSEAPGWLTLVVIGCRLEGHGVPRPIAELPRTLHDAVWAAAEALHPHSPRGDRWPEEREPSDTAPSKPDHGLARPFQNEPDFEVGNGARRGTMAAAHGASALSVAVIPAQRPDQSGKGRRQGPPGQFFQNEPELSERTNQQADGITMETGRIAGGVCDGGLQSHAGELQPPDGLPNPVREGPAFQNEPDIGERADLGEPHVDEGPTGPPRRWPALAIPHRDERLGWPPSGSGGHKSQIEAPVSWPAWREPRMGGGWIEHPAHEVSPMLFGESDGSGPYSSVAGNSEFPQNEPGSWQRQEAASADEHSPMPWVPDLPPSARPAGEANSTVQPDHPKGAAERTGRTAVLDQPVDVPERASDALCDIGNWGDPLIQPGVAYETRLTGGSGGGGGHGIRTINPYRMGGYDLNDPNHPLAGIVPPHQRGSGSLDDPLFNPNKSPLPGKKRPMFE